MKQIAVIICIFQGLLDCNVCLSQQSNLDWSERLLNSTVRIETTLINGSTVTGTGYFFSFDFEQGIPVVITNNHVLKGASKVKFSLKERTKDGEPDYTKVYDLEIPISLLPVISHPDPTIDLCVIPLVTLESGAEKVGRTIYLDIGSEKAIPNQEILDELLAIEEIHMIGYPNGIWDSKNNLPIVRKGLTATNPVVDYEGRKEFLIDIAAFPGSSGSPVYLYNPGPYQTKTSIKLGGRIYLLGTLYAGPMFGVEGRIIRLAPTVQIDTTSSAYMKVPMNLGYVIKSEKIMDFKPILISMHKRMKASNR